MKCNNCGVEIPYGSRICPTCGAPQTQQPTTGYEQSYGQHVSMKDAGTGLKVLSFLFPIIGIILWAVKRTNAPVAAKSYLKWGLYGIAATIIVNFLYLIF